MINHNPYNLPQKVLRQSHLPKQINNLYRKVSHQHSTGSNNPMKKSGNYMNVPDQLKMSMSPQHYISVSNNSTSNRAVQYVPYEIKEIQIDKKLKNFNQRLMNLTNQVCQHQEKIGYLVKGKNIQKNKKIESPLDAEINSPQKISKQILSYNIEKVNVIMEQFKKQIKQLKLQIKGTSINQLKTITNQLQNNKVQFPQNRQLGVINSNIEQIKMAIEERFKKSQKNIQSNQNRIIGVNQKVDSIQANIEQHMQLVNNQINNALSKLVSSINQRVNKVLQNNLSIVNQKLNLFQQKNINPAKVQVLQKVKQLKLSGFKSQKKSLKINYQNIIKGVQNNSVQNKQEKNIEKKVLQTNQQLVISDQVFFIDEQGYLLDSNKVYLMDQNQNLILLSADHLQILKEKFQFS